MRYVRTPRYEPTLGHAPTLKYVRMRRHVPTSRSIQLTDPCQYLPSYEIRVGAYGTDLVLAVLGYLLLVRSCTHPMSGCHEVEGKCAFALGSCLERVRDRQSWFCFEEVTTAMSESWKCHEIGVKMARKGVKECMHARKVLCCVCKKQQHYGGAQLTRSQEVTVREHVCHILGHALHLLVHHLLLLLLLGHHRA